MLPVLSCPAILAPILKFVATLPFSTTEVIDVVNLCLWKAKLSPQHDALKSNPNSVIFGGTIVPAATAPMPIVRSTLAPTSREAYALGVGVLEGHAMLVLNRFVSPEKATWVGVGSRDLVNEK